MKRWLKIALSAGKSWYADNIFQYAAAVSFSTLFSLVPITIIAIGIAGLFLGRQAASVELERQISALVGPPSAEMLHDAVNATEAARSSKPAAVVGVVLVLFGATTVFGQLQSALNQIWHVRTQPSKSGWLLLVMRRLLSLAMVLTLGFLLIVSLIVSSAISLFIQHYGGPLAGSSVVLKAADVTAGLVIVMLLMAMLFKVLPDVQLRWRDVWLGATLTSVLFTIGRFLIALYLGYSTVASIYGKAGSLVALLIWVYYSCAILFYGVEFTRAYRMAHHLDVQPKATAELVHEEVVGGRVRRMAR